MKILLLAPIHHEREYRGQREEEKKRLGRIENSFLIGQAESSWKRALEELGHSVEVFIYTESILMPNTLRVWLKEYCRSKLPEWYFQYLRWARVFYRYSLENRLRNRKLLGTVEKLRPDLILITGGTSSIFPETVKYIKENFSVKIVLMNGMSPLWSVTRTEREMVEFIDCFFTNDKYHAIQWLELGAKKAHCLPISSVDPYLHKRIPLSEEETRQYGCDLCFVGGLYPEKWYRERLRVLAALREFDLGIWSEDKWEILHTDKWKGAYRGVARGLKMVKIYNAAKIVINVHGNFMQAGGNMRTFEVPGCGAFQLIDRVDPAWFEIGEEVVRFTGIDDLKEKIKYYLEHPEERERIARRGQERAYRDHTYQKRFGRLLEIVDGL